MTFQVFVGYSDAVAKRIAEGLGHYLHRLGINAFVASTDPNWMLPGFNVNRILQKLAASDILIAVCTGNTPVTSKLGGEIRFARSNNMPILPFVEKGTNPPFGLQNIWKMEFSLNRPWNEHRTLAIYILSLIEKNMETRVQSLAPRI